MYEVDDPSFQKRILRVGDGLEKGVAQDREKVGVCLERLAEGGEELCLAWRVRRFVCQGSLEKLERIHAAGGHSL